MRFYLYVVVEVGLDTLAACIAQIKQLIGCWGEDKVEEGFDNVYGGYAVGRSSAISCRFNDGPDLLSSESFLQPSIASDEIGEGVESLDLDGHGGCRVESEVQKLSDEAMLLEDILVL